jgi:primosomal protein N' (replication factor Y)
LQSIGLVVIDEAHDGAFKQDSGIRYNGLLVAAALANIHNARFIIGSATPPVQETYQLLSKGAKLVCMHEVAITTNSADKNFKVVAMNTAEERSQSPLLSKQLLHAIQLALSQKSQILLFLNKRGTAKLLLCEACGWHAQCPDCELPLTYHHDTYTMRCHICGHSASVPIQCPDCTQELAQKSFGVKAIESELHSLFPHARIKRFDSDTKKSNSFSSQYNSIADGEVDIILGTQLVTKGLDLPKLSLVGILSADSALLLPDYTSEERAFQQLTQVSGRVGRGHGVSSVVIQTYEPKNELFHFVTQQDWHAFYGQEVIKRKNAYYPPFCYLLKIWVGRSSESGAQKAIQAIADTLRKNKKYTLLGPAPAFYEKVGKKHQWQLVVSAPSRALLLNIIEKLPKNTHFDIDPVSLL